MVGVEAVEQPLSEGRPPRGGLGPPYLIYNTLQTALVRSADNGRMRVAGLLALTMFLGACGGGSGGSTPTSTPSASPSAPVAANPCTAALSAQGEASAAVASSSGKPRGSLARDKRDWRDVSGHPSRGG